jgi:hypothetical protein
MDRAWYPTAVACSGFRVRGYASIVVKLRRNELNYVGVGCGGSKAGTEQVRSEYVV